MTGVCRTGLRLNTRTKSATASIRHTVVGDGPACSRVINTFRNSPAQSACNPCVMSTRPTSVRQPEPNGNGLAIVGGLRSVTSPVDEIMNDARISDQIRLRRHT